METIYLSLVHTGNRGNLFHEIPGIIRQIESIQNLKIHSLCASQTSYICKTFAYKPYLDIKSIGFFVEYLLPKSELPDSSPHKHYLNYYVPVVQVDVYLGST